MTIFSSKTSEYTYYLQLSYLLYSKSILLILFKQPSNISNNCFHQIIPLITEKILRAEYLQLLSPNILHEILSAYSYATVDNYIIISR